MSIPGRPVRDLRDGVVEAYDPPRHSVRVRLARYEGASVRDTVEHEVYIGETAALAREDIIAVRNARLLVILGPTSLDTPEPAWHLVHEEDVVLASVRMPGNTATVVPSAIVDRHAYAVRLRSVTFSAVARSRADGHSRVGRDRRGFVVRAVGGHRARPRPAAAPSGCPCPE